MGKPKIPSLGKKYSLVLDRFFDYETRRTGGLRKNTRLAGSKWSPTAYQKMFYMGQ